MTRPDQLVLDDPDAIRALRGDLDRAGFSGRGLAAALRIEANVPFLPADVPVYARRLAGDSRLETLIRAFWLGLPVEHAALNLALPAVSPETLAQLALVEQRDGHLEARVRLVPYESLILACDRAEPGAQAARDLVPGVHPPSAVLANLTVRQAVDVALDLGTGLGIQALLAAPHSRHVVATDVNPRALAFLAFNAILNGVGNVEARLGSFFEPVAGERFDLLVANPPYVVSPENRFIFRDGGLPGDAVSRLVVQQAPDHLAEGGMAHILVSWIHGSERPWREPLEGWISGRGCDAWLLHLASQDPLSTAANWIDPLGVLDPAVVGPELDRWLSYYRELGAEAVAYGSVALRRRGSTPGRPNWTRAEDLPDSPVSPAGEQVGRIFAAHDFLAAGHEVDALLDLPLRVASRHRLEQVARPGPEGYEVEGTALRVEEGIPFVGPVDPLIVATLWRCDGRRLLRDVMADAAAECDTSVQDAWPDLGPVVRRLLELGVLAIPDPT